MSPGLFLCTMNWSDRPLVIVGGGLSAKTIELDDLPEVGRVMLINDATKFTYGDILFSADAHWIKTRYDIMATFQGESYVARYEALRPHMNIPTNVTEILLLPQDEFSTKPGAVASGGNSGHGALNLAILGGAKDIILVGYDMTPGPRVHWHDGYEDQAPRTPNHAYYSGWPIRMAANVELLKKLNVRVRNANPQSGLTCFPRHQPEELGLRRK